MIDYSFSLYDFEYFLLVLVRISTFVFVAPFFSMSNTPARVRIAISFFTAILLYGTLSPADMPASDSVLQYAIVVLREAMTGLLIGFGTNMCTSIVSVTGAIADMETGLSMATLYDPATRQNTSITGVLYQYAVTMMLIASGMYRYLFGALADTFVLIPVNGAVFHADSLLENVIVFMSDYILIGFRIVLPIFCVMILLNSILGVLAKVAPQMNMFAVGMQIKIIVGLGTMFLTIGLLENAADFIFREMKVMITGFVQSMT
ncbi:MAG: flagellar biosynthetic protein FliR [Lachnospiraceae bacterium]|nr:flagellar biosynthetic protein FliR [Lachnospiraceae bacterium]